MCLLYKHTSRWLCVLALAIASMVFLINFNSIKEIQPKDATSPSEGAHSQNLQSPPGKSLSPLTLEFNIRGTPALGQVFTLVMHIATQIDAPDIVLQLELPEGVILLEQFNGWQGDLHAGEGLTLSVQAKIVQPGEWRVVAEAASHPPGGYIFGDRQVWYLDVSAEHAIISELPAALRDGNYSARTAGELRADAQMPDTPLWPIYPSGNPKLERLNQDASPAAGTIAVYGRFEYEDKNNIEHAIPYAKVKVYDEETGDDTLLGITYTDNVGYFQLTVNNDPSDLADIYAIVLAQDDISVWVSNFSTSPIVYFFQTPTYYNRPDGNFNMGSYVVTDAVNRMSWYIYDKIANQAYFFLFNEVGWMNNYNLQVRWDANNISDGTHYHPGGTMDLLAGDRWDEDIFLHEYGHFVMYYIYTVNPPTPNCYPHVWGVNSSLGCAWSEGWANFIKGAIQNHDDYVDTEDQILHYHMEPPTPVVASDLDEASVTASFWDIFDAANETHDTLTDGINDSGLGLWDVIFDNDPNNAYEFWDDWFTSGNGDNCAVSKILEHHLIDVFDACPPTGLTASDGTFTNKVSLDWPNFPNAASYQVYQATSLGGSKTQLGITTTSDFEDSSATPEREYYYFYKACNAIACGDYSTFDTGWREMTIPAGLSASDGTYTDKVRLTWSSVSAATFYRLFYSTSAGGPPVYLTQTTNLLYDTNPATPERPYYYWVQACNEYGCSDYSTVESGYREMPTPASVAASDGSYTGQIRITWVNILGATYYKVYRATSPGSQAYLADSSNAYYDDTSAIPGRTYYYYIQAYNSYGSGAQSSYDSGWREMAIPTGFSATDGAYIDKTRITWSSVYGADTYSVYRSETAGGATMLLGSPAGTSLDDSSGTPERHYFYYVKACNAYRCSSLSAYNEGWREVASPTGLTASDGSYTNIVDLNWNSLSGATHYKVYGGVTSSSFSYLGETSFTNYQHTSGTPERIYYYHVEACNSYGCGGYSNDDTGWRELTAPTGLSASDGTFAGRVFLEWTSNPDATYYKVYRGATADNLAYLSDAPTAAFSDYTASAGNTYYYAVQACNIYGCGLKSSSDSGSCTVGAVSWVSASDGVFTDKVFISWGNVTSADFYQVFRISYSPTQNEIYLGQTTSTNLDDIFAVPEQIYDYYVLACEDGGTCSEPIAHNSGYREMPTASNLQASDGTEFAAVYVSWDWIEGAEYIRLYRAPTSSGPWQALYIGNITGYLDTDIIDVAPYYYWVQGCNSFGCGDIIINDSGYCTNSDTAATASDGTDSSYVWVSFTDLPAAISYKIMRTPTPDDPGSWIQVAGDFSSQSPLAPATTYAAPADVAGLEYYFAVVACGMAHGQMVCGEMGAYDSGWRTMPAPFNTQASDGTVPCGVSVSWAFDLFGPSDPGPDYFEIYRADAVDGSKVYLGQSNTSPFTAPEAETGVLYYYWIKACNAYICSEYSVSDSGYTPYPVYLPLIQKSSSVARAGDAKLSLLLAGLMLFSIQGVLRRQFHCPVTPQ